MKKNFILTSILAVSALLLSVSCAKIEQSEILSEVADGTIFTASIDQDDAKTVLTESYKVNWEAGDKININGATYSATPMDPATQARFTKTSGTNPNSPYKAVFPSTLYSNQAFSFPAIQTYQDGKFNAPMYAESETEMLSFKNICGVICLSLKGTDKVKSISLIANEAVCGAFTMTDATTVNLTGTGKTVTLNLGADGVQLNSDVATKFYIYLPPKEYSAGMKIIATNTDGLVFKKTTAKAVTVERSNVYTFNMTADFALALNGEFSVSASKKVKFSQGNIYAKKNGTAWTWGFYDNQYAYNSLSTAASRTARTSDTEIDLFTWGYGTWSTSPTTTAYLEDHTEDGETLLASEDWSSRIGDGTLWRSLTFDEWMYLFNDRDGADKKAMDGVTVCGKENCLVIAPDNFAGTIESSYDAAAWGIAEEAGLVCLPAAGMRYSSSVVQANNYGYYWSSTASGKAAARFFCFGPVASPAPASVESRTVTAANNADGGQGSATNVESAKPFVNFESAQNQFKNLTLTKSEKVSAHKASSASNGVQQKSQAPVKRIDKALKANHTAPVKMSSVKAPAVRTSSINNDSGYDVVDVTAVEWEYTDYETDMMYTLFDAKGDIYQFDIYYSGSIELGHTYTYADMDKTYSCYATDGSGYAFGSAEFTITEGANKLKHIEASVSVPAFSKIFNITFDEPAPQPGKTVEVTATKYQFDSYYSDFYLIVEDGFYIFEMKNGAPVIGKTYTLDDMVSYYTGWYAEEDEGYLTTRATAATLKMTQTEEGLINIVGTMTLKGDEYIITYKETPFVPSGKKINVNATNYKAEKFASYGEYCYSASNADFADMQIWVLTDNEFGTFSGENVEVEYSYLETSGKEIITFHSVATPIVVAKDAEGNKSLTGSLYAENGDEYVFNLTAEKPATKELNIKVANATLNNRIAGGYWTIDGQTVDKNNSFSIYFISKALQGSFTDVEKFDSYSTWVSDKSSGSNVYYENLSAVDLTSVVDGDSLKVTGTMNLADFKGNPAVATVYITTPFKQTWGEWNDFAPFDKNTGKYAFATLGQWTQTRIKVLTRKDNTGLKEFIFKDWSAGYFAETGVDLTVSMNPDNSCAIKPTSLKVGTTTVFITDSYTCAGMYPEENYYDPEEGVFHFLTCILNSSATSILANAEETLTMDRPITPKETITVNSRTLSAFYEESIAGYVYQSNNETYSSIQFVTNSDQKLGTFTIDELQNNYTFVRSAKGTVTFEEGSITVSEDEAGLKLTGRLIGTDENAYEFNLIQPVGVLEFDTDAPFDAEFISDDITISIKEGVVSISATNADNQTIALELYVNPSATEIPEGTYVISDTKEAGTALKSQGLSGNTLTKCFAGLRGTSGISNGWFMLEGTVTISYSKYGEMLVSIAAKNSYGQDVTVKTIGGSARDYGYSVRLVTDVK